MYYIEPSCKHLLHSSILTRSVAETHKDKKRGLKLGLWQIPLFETIILV